MRTDRRTDMTKLTAAFRNSANAPKMARGPQHVPSASRLSMANTMRQAVSEN